MSQQNQNSLFIVLFAFFTLTSTVLPQKINNFQQNISEDIMMRNNMTEGMMMDRLNELDKKIEKIEIESEFMEKKSWLGFSQSFQVKEAKKEVLAIKSYRGNFFSELSHYCSIKGQRNATISKIFSFQSHTQSYLGYSITQNSLTKFVFLNSYCQTIAELHSQSIIDILTDRNNLPHGSLYLVSTHYQIFGCSEITNFTDCTRISRLRESGSFVGEYIGGMTRSKSKGNIEIFIIQSLGPIIVFDQNGNNKLGISFEYESPILSIIDHHPDPILATQSNWLFYLDTLHYTISPSNCVYPNLAISRLVSTNPYSPYFYLVSQQSIVKYEIKPQNKNCDLTRRVYSPQIAQANQSQNVEEYSNSLFLGSIIVNLTKLTATVQRMQVCNESLQLTFQGWRNYQKNGFIGMSCCNKEKCSVEMFKASEPQEYEKKTVFLITLSLLLFLWGIFYFFRSVEPKFLENQEMLVEYERHNNGFKEEVDTFLSKKKGKNLRKAKNPETTTFVQKQASNS